MPTDRIVSALPARTRWRAWFSRHVLLLAVISLVPAFLFTRWLVGRYRTTEHRLAAAWYERGEVDLRAGRVTQAVDDYRAALGYARDNPAYRLRLAQALGRAGRVDPALADLRRLWEDEPGDSVVNLELARLLAREHEVKGATRYYTNAIYGTWPADAAARRRETQIELVDYLLANGRNAEALAGLIALAADAPADPALRLSIGTRMLRAGADREALREFQEAIALAPHSAPALAAAGAVAFRLHQLPDAQRYLRLAVQAGDRDPATTRLLAITRNALAFDPSERGLPSPERVRRVRAAFDVVTRAFAACVPGLNPADEASQDAAAALHSRFGDTARILRTADARDAQVQQDAMDVVFDTEEFLASHCGPVSSEDEALLVLGRSRRGQP